MSTDQPDLVSHQTFKGRLPGDRAAGSEPEGRAVALPEDTAECIRQWAEGEGAKVRNRESLFAQELIISPIHGYLRSSPRFRR